MRTLLIVTFLFASIHVMAQDDSILLGKWDVLYVDSEEKAVYEFKKENGVVVGYCISYTDESGENDTLMDKIITDIKIEGKKGEARYQGDYDGTKFNMKSKFKIINQNRIETKYSYLFYKGEEVWTRKTKAL